jgi:hypothetical protein
MLFPPRLILWRLWWTVARGFWRRDQKSAGGCGWGAEMLLVARLEIEDGSARASDITWGCSDSAATWTQVLRSEHGQKVTYLQLIEDKVVCCRLYIVSSRQAPARRLTYRASISRAPVGAIPSALRPLLHDHRGESLAAHSFSLHTRPHHNRPYPNSLPPIYHRCAPALLDAYRRVPIDIDCPGATVLGRHSLSSALHFPTSPSLPPHTTTPSALARHAPAQLPHRIRICPRPSAIASHTRIALPLRRLVVLRHTLDRAHSRGPLRQHQRRRPR